MGSVRVGAHDIEVVEAPVGDLRSDSKLGVSDLIGNQITIPAEAPPSRKMEILFHEMVHFMLLGHAAAFPDGKFPEETVTVLLGEGIVAMVRDNPDLIKEALKVFKKKEEKKNGRRK